MHIGFTGTQDGMSDRQKEALETKLVEIYTKWYDAPPDKPLYFHHGCCIGADAQAHNVAWLLGYLIIQHPPANRSKEAFLRPWHIKLSPRNYLDRNHDIVDASEILIAAPKGPEILRSGTWATVRYARKIGKPVIILPGTP